MLTTKYDPIVVPENEKSDLAILGRIVESVSQNPSHEGARLVGPNREEIVIPSSLFNIIRQLLHHLTNGQAISIVPVNTELTTQQAADLLNVSRPYLVKLLETNEIPYRKINSHRRIQVQDLMNYKSKRDAEREELLKQLSEDSRDLGLFN